MKKITLSIIMILYSFVSFSQNTPEKVNLDFVGLSQKLRISKTENVLGIGNVSKSEVILNLPLLNGLTADFKMVEYFIVPEGSKTDIKTYYGEQVGDPLVTCRVTLTKDKIMASIIENGQTIIVEKETGSLLSNEYQVYVQKKSPLQCDNVIEEQIKNGRIGEARGISSYSYGGTLKTYKLALIVTNEFYIDFVNDAGVNAEIVAIVNNMNALYEKEVAVRMTLVSPNNPVSSNFFYRKTETTTTYYQNLPAVRNEVDSRFGNINYDLGHCLHNSGGGVAGLGVICSGSGKGRGWSGSTTASSILLFAHELGHQFNAGHTFNGNGVGSCSFSNRDDASAYEPGSGNTIMSYANLCSPGIYNISGGNVPYFHAKSLQDISSYITSGTGSTCGIATATSNTPPVVSAGLSYTIPKNTPFKLVGTGSDINNDVLTYTWEQFNLAAVSDTGKLGHKTNTLGGNAVDSPTAPLFRTAQSSLPIRYFPALSYVLNNANNPADNIGEDLPNVSRTMKFWLTARDSKNGGGGVHCSEVLVTVDATKGPLSVSSPNTAITIAAGSSHMVTWSVNSTNSLSANVKILLSVDGGGSFPFTLSTSTPNDGSHSITIPSNVPNSTTARIIVASNNSLTAEFFDASDVNFSITSTCLVKSSIVCTESPVSAMAGNASLNLGMSKVAALTLLNNTKVLPASPTTNRALINYSDENLNTCQNSGNQPSILLAFRVSKSDNYTFFANGDNGANFQPFSVFSSNVFNCTNFVGGNSYQNMGLGWVYNRTLQLNACQTYYILINPVFGPNNITLSISGSGELYEVITDPAGFSYTYAAVNQSTNLIGDVSPTSNFTNTSAGSYKIYGLMYANGFNTNTLLGKTMEQAYGLGSCILFSNNSKPVTIIPNPCATTLTLVSPTDNISLGNVTKEAATGVGGKITATNLVTGAGTRATFTARAIELNQGFLADQGTIFRAEVGGCN